MTKQKIYGELTKCSLKYLIARLLSWTGAIIAFGCLVACNMATPPAPPPPAVPAIVVPPPPSRAPRPDITDAKASWYGPGFAGRKTSTGERYNPNALTAASKTLPIGSVVKVTNPSNGRSVKVRINDRGPFVAGRSLDLSNRAARKLGILHKGVVRVKLAKPTLTHNDEVIDGDGDTTEGKSEVGEKKEVTDAEIPH